ncbi:MAG: replicative DNA helicase, partial [Opitutaceae bacterium]
MDQSAPAALTGRPSAPASPAARMLPHSLEAVEHLLSCCLLDGADVVARCLENRITSSCVYDARHGVIFEQLLE